MAEDLAPNPIGRGSARRKSRSKRSSSSITTTPSSILHPILSVNRTRRWAMASNRIEKLQMRQRGAGTRKIKEVDFGFSLGFGPPAEDSSQAASQPANGDLNTAPAPAPVPPPLILDAPPLASEPTTTSSEPSATVIPQARSTPSPTRINAYAASQNQLQRTPGSARNKLPPRPSTFDIPADKESELERSNKRRKIDSPKGDSPSIGAQPEVLNIDNPPNDISEELSLSLDENRAIPIRTVPSNHAPLLDQEPAVEAPSIPTIEPNENPQEAQNEASGHPETGDTTRPEAPHVDGTTSPVSDSSKSSGRRRRQKGRRSPSQNDIANLESTETVEHQAVENEFAKPLPSTEAVETAQNRISHEPEPPRTRDKRTRSRTPASASPVVAKRSPTEEPGSEPIEATQEQLDEPQPPEIREQQTRSQIPALSQSSAEPAASDRQLIEEAALEPDGVPQEAESQESDATGTREKPTRSQILASVQPPAEAPPADVARTEGPESGNVEALLEPEAQGPDNAGLRETLTRNRTPASVQPPAEAPPADIATTEGAESGTVDALLEPEAQSPDNAGPREKRTRSRTPAIVQPPAKPPTADEATTKVASSEAVPSVIAGKGIRGRKKKNLEPTHGIVVTRPDSAKPTAARVETEVAPDEAMAERSESSDHPNEIDKGKKRAGRPKKQALSPQAIEEPVTSKKKRQREEQVELGERVETTPEQEQPDADVARAGRRKKQRIEQEPSLSEDRAEPEPESEGSRFGKRRKGRQGHEPTPEVERAEPDAEALANRAGRKKRQPQERLPGQEQSTQESDIDRARVGGGRKRREKQTPTTVQEEQPEAEPEDVERARADKGKKRQERAPTAEEEQREPETEIEREPRAGQPPTDTERRGKPTTQPDEPPQENATEDHPQPKKRKPRQPRGETVPVTVHRLTNPALLGGEPLESSDEEDAGADEPSSKQPTKLPSRGGVNAADVLAQICRETLEKTLTTLKTGIENEANATRRAEWTLRRKAVEAYGAELEGRLFDLSEMLDSNFMLSAKVKKAKRNMLDLRGRLDRVRREREAVALRMDAVRREHAKEEQAGLARSTINHSLHNLDLALERGQNRTTAQDESLTAGLEFRLRSLARNVSSSVPGSYGGILHQIKSFNAQLEATARRLEG
ncbi:uncharacterized protein DSM5745_08783 [Aspergillus mulundensis]|uniref:Inner kinetochore subunit AME1 domain-containing protein n=1 Tax=Aspergillus mulundensis TaxID=1810919 RepID=A0A3D8R4P5_9EURO|nr:Uncharacterized protein DSM5745_08783 [Aspergillus mulundensis]RDW69023.1 Uncharacterized protein DSM5745_08783 [Aspergillus mulundensis]